MILKLRMYSDENENFVRDYEIPADMSLKQVNDFIISSLEFVPCMTSFFLLDNDLQVVEEITLMDMSDAELSFKSRTMDSVRLADVILDGYMNLALQFDMILQRSFFLKIIGKVEKRDDIKYPVMTFENAPVPDQFDPNKVDPTEGSIFEEMMDGYSDFDGDDSRNDEW
ncbi:MAG: hypothetical protein KBS95_07325 [Alistipes sp.]|nr:hypothetical protein [Candidatus Alistipes equi]